MNDSASAWNRSSASTLDLTGFERAARWNSRFDERESHSGISFNLAKNE